MSYTTNAIVSTQKIRTSIANLGTLSTTGQAWTVSLTSTTNLQPVVTAGVNGSRVTSLIFTTTDSAANNVYIIVQPGGTGYLSVIGQCNVPLTSGTAASVFGTDALSKTTFPGLPLDNYGKPYIHLGANDILYFGTIANMTADKILFGFAVVEDY